MYFKQIITRKGTIYKPVSTLDRCEVIQVLHTNIDTCAYSYELTQYIHQLYHDNHGVLY